MICPFWIKHGLLVIAPFPKRFSYKLQYNEEENYTNAMPNNLVKMKFNEKLDPLTIHIYI